VQRASLKTMVRLIVRSRLAGREVVSSVWVSTGFLHAFKGEVDCAGALDTSIPARNPLDQHHFVWKGEVDCALCKSVSLNK
jgi:hypothetical protein